MATRPFQPIAAPRGDGTLAGTVERLPEAPPIVTGGDGFAPTPGISELFSAGLEAHRNDRTDFETQMLADGYAPILDALGLDPTQSPAGFHDNQANRNPILKRSELLARRGRGAFGALADRATQEQLIATAIRDRRRQDPDFLKGVPDTVRGLRSMFAKREQERRAAALATLDRSEGAVGWAVGFAGGASQMLTDPANVATLPIGGGGGTIARIVLREALVNAVIEAAQQPVVAGNREAIGETLTVGEAAANVAIAGIAGGVLEGALVAGARGAGAGYDKSAEALFNALPERTQRAWADRMKVGIEVDGKTRPVLLTDLLEGVSNRDLADATRRVVGPARMTPEELAAANVLEREQEIGEASPFEPGPGGDAEHQDRLAEAVEALSNGRLPADPLAPLPEPGAAPVTAGQRIAAELRQAIDEAEPLANVATDASRGSPGPSAASVSRETSPPLPPQVNAAVVGDAAVAQFKAWTRRAESGGDDAADNPNSSADGRYQITDGTFRQYWKRLTGQDPGPRPPRSLKNKPANQELVMDALTADNRALLRRAGAPETAGNLYLAHFLGPSASKLLRADPDRPVVSLLPGSFISSNPEVLGGKSASQVIAWAHRKMGGSAASVPPRGASGLLASAGDDALVAQLRADALRSSEAAIGGVLGETTIPGVGSVPLYSARLRPSQFGIDAERFQFKSGGDGDGVLDTLKGVGQWDPARSGRVLYWQDVEGRYWIADGHQRAGLARRLEAGGAEVYVDGMVIREADGVSADDARSYGALLNILNRSADPVDAAKVLRGLGFDTELGLPPNSALVRNANGIARLSDAAFGAVVNGHLAPDMAAVIGRLLPDDADAHETMTQLLIRLDPANSAQAESIVRQAMAAGMHREQQIDLFGSGETVSSLFLDRAKVMEKGLARLRNAKLAYKTAAKEADTLERAGSTIAREASAREAQVNAEAIEIVRRVAYRQGPVADALNTAAARLAAGGKLGDVVDEWVAAIRGIDLDEVARGADDVPAGRGGDGGDFGNDQFGEQGGDLFAQPADPGQPELGRAFDEGTGDGPAAQTASVEHDIRMDLADDGLTGFRLDPDGDERAIGDILDELDGDQAAADTLKGCL